MEIRPITKSDLPSLKNVLDNCELFPSEYLDEMIDDYLENPETKDIWFTAVENTEIRSIAYCAPMTFTNGTYNLYAIGVHNDYQGKGIGRLMMTYIEDQLRSNGNRVLIVETSGKDALRLTREFYDKCQYNKEATLRDFWDEGDDKIIYWKKL